MKDSIDFISKEKENFACRRSGDELLLIPVKDNVSDFNQYLTLNEVGAFIWENITQLDDEDSLVSKICTEFDTEETLVRKDLVHFIPQLQQFIVGE